MKETQTKSMITRMQIDRTCVVIQQSLICFQRHCCQWEFQLHRFIYIKSWHWKWLKSRKTSTWVINTVLLKMKKIILIKNCLKKEASRYHIKIKSILKIFEKFTSTDKEKTSLFSNLYIAMPTKLIQHNYTINTHRLRLWNLVHILPIKHWASASKCGLMLC